MTLLIVLAALCCLAFLPLGFRAVYRQDDPGVWLLVGPLKFRVDPGKPTDNEQPKEPAKKKKSSESASKRGGSYRDFLPVVRSIIDFLSQFRRKIRVNHLEMKLILVGNDPCDLAVNYGRAWAALGSLMPQLERLFVIRKRNVEVECDFASEETVIFARADVTITLARTLHLLSRHGIKVLKELLKLKKLRKGGAQL